jgi:O-antigen/teichoic acid export membrane protein
VLGETDFGIYNVVGGITIMLSFVTNAMTSATQRFLNVEIGKGNIDGFKKVFCMSVNLYALLSIIFIVLAETIGLWFLTIKLNIPVERKDAAMWVYQYSILASCFTLFRIPYSASIIAYERMSFYAYISIIEAALKLFCVYLLMIERYDSLMLYAALNAAISGIILFGSYAFCRRVLNSCSYSLFWDKAVSKQLLSFSGWSLMGGMSVVSANQGVVFILNIFCGVVVNASLGIANQVQSAVSSFVSGFQTAFNPQIVKSYITGGKEEMYNLIINTSRFSLFLIMIPTIPIFIWCDNMLALWLGALPEYTSEFTRIIILIIFFDTLSNPLFITIQATGNIRIYQCWVSLLLLLSLPVAYVLLKFGYSPYIVMVSRFVIFIFLYIGRLIHLKRIINLPVLAYIKNVVVKGCEVMALSLIYPLFTCKSNNFILHVIVTIVITIGSIIAIGLNKSETNMLLKRLHRK